MKNFIMVFGTHGSGKTTLVKNILMSDYISDVKGNFLLDCFNFFENRCKFGRYTISKGGKYVAVGSYKNNCGGADGIKNAENYFSIIDFLLDNFKDKNICIEGVLEHNFERIMQLYQKVKKMNFNIHLILLQSSLDVEVKRIKNRSGNNPNIKHIKSKANSMKRLFEKFIKIDWLNCHIIDTNNISAKEVFIELEKLL